MIWTIIALALWVVLGGFISYYGDLQGRRWGKKRVSWFGMRPKHTAILITSLTGGFIALFSILSLMIIVQPVRDVLTHGADAIRNNKHLLAEEKSQQLLYKRERDKANEESRVKQLQNEQKLADGRRKLADLQKQYAEATLKIEPLQGRLASLSKRLSNLGIQMRKERSRLAMLQIEQTNAGLINEELGKQNVALVDQKAELDKTNHELKAANGKLDQINKELQNSHDQLVTSNEQFYQSNLTFEKSNSKLINEKTLLEKQVSDLTHTRDEMLGLISQRDELNAQLKALGTRIAEEYNVLRQGYVTLRAGVELARISMDANLRPDAITRQVTALMAAASEQAKSFGAAADNHGHAACLAPQTKVTLTGYDTKDENAQLASMANDWAGQDKSFVVVATTLTNCLVGEPAYIDLRRYPVVRVFRKGDAVASRTIDGHASMDDIITNLMAFLHNDVQKSALHAGIIPRVDPESGAAEVGTLGQGELFSLADTVRRMRGPVVLTARAKQDISSADRLSLTFKVSRPASQAQTVAAD